MSGYLEKYGAGEERRGKIIKILLLSLVTLVVVGGALVFQFYNIREERLVMRFIGQLQAHDYKGAYALFGCTDAKPCRDYPINRFMEDWGPNSGHNALGAAHISRSRSCGSGVLLTIDYSPNTQEKLWVDRDSTISFPPMQGCPAKP
jgi:hypothetical protein